MGTRGYRVWRHKGRYLFHYNHSDSYPHGLGVEVWRTIPKSYDEAERWVQRTRKWAEEQMQRVESGGFDDEREQWEWRLGGRPCNDVFIEWIYEMDLDNCVFHVQGVPVYNLLRMPPSEDAFLQLREHYRDMIDSYTYIPNKHRWDSRLDSLVLPVDVAALDAYVALNCTVVEHIVPPSSEDKTIKVRRRLAETFIAALRATDPFVNAAFEAHTTNDLNQMSETVREIISFLNKVTLRPPIVATSDYLQHRATPLPLSRLWDSLRSYTLPNNEEWLSRACWVRPNVCVYFHPHLNDESNLHAGVVGLARAISLHAPPEGVVYGVLNSVTHCALLAYDAKTQSVTHTLALPLLPSWGEIHLNILSTPGTIALTNLCRHLDDADGGHPSLHAPKTVDSGRLPFDVLAVVAAFIQDGDTLLCFAAASSVCKQAAKPRLMLPIMNSVLVEELCEDRLVGGANPKTSQVYCGNGQIASVFDMWCLPDTRPSFDDILDLFNVHSDADKRVD